MGAYGISVKKVKPEQVGLEATIMGIREFVMEYFKGDCVQRVVYANNLTAVSLAEYVENPRQSYLRRKLAEQRQILLLLGGVPILTLKHRPDTVVLHMAVLERSKQFRDIHKQLDKFLSKFLAGVRKEENHAHIIYKP